jgi:non-ribosomal peptide synthetase-like protein
MPGIVIDLVRYLGSLLLFSFCLLLAGVALYPCVLEHQLVAETWGRPWSILVVPFLYGQWGFSYALLAVLFKHAVRYHPKEGSVPLFSTAVIGWAVTGAVTNFARYTFLVHLKGTPFLNVYFRLLGVKMGRRVSINTVEIYEWDMITLGDDVVLGGDCCLMAHSVEGGRMVMRPIRIDDKAMVGGNAKVMPGAIIEERGVLGASSLLKKGGHIKAGETWGGIPAHPLPRHVAKDTVVVGARSGDGAAAGGGGTSGDAPPPPPAAA